MKIVNIQWDFDGWDFDGEDGTNLLPNEIAIPKGMTDIDEISDYISNIITGFCHKGFKIENEEEDGDFEN